MDDLSTRVQDIRTRVSQSLDLMRENSDDDIRDAVQAAVNELLAQEYMSLTDQRLLLSEAFNSMRGYDVLQSLVDDKSITEIMVVGPDKIFVERNGRVEKTNVRFESVEREENVIQAIVARVNRIVNESSPICDARLSDGSRVNVVLPPVALDGPVLTIRKFSESPLTVQNLIDYGSITPEVAVVLEQLVRAKFNIVVSGGTGSGKTTFLNALSGFIPADERIITIEDSAELQITSVENLVRMETRGPNVEGKNAITIKDLIKSSLRMRPERIVVGEVRGGEALDMLQAMNTGHDGSLSTGHANSSRDMLSRLETMVLSGADLPLDAIRRQISSAVDVIIQLSRLRDKSRRVMEITEVLDMENGEIQLNPLYVFEETGTTGSGLTLQVHGELRRTQNPLYNTDKFARAGIDPVILKV